MNKHVWQSVRQTAHIRVHWCRRCGAIRKQIERAGKKTSEIVLPAQAKECQP